LDSGGAQRQIVNLAIGLKEKDFSVTVVYYNSGDHFISLLQDNQIDTLFLDKSKIGIIGIIRQLNIYIRNNDFRIIISYLFRPSIIAIIVKILSQFKIKVIVSERSFDHKASVFVKIVRRFYVFADAIVANSASQTEFLKTSYSKFAKKIFYIPNGNMYVKSTPKKKEDESWEIIAIGNINDNKNTKYLIESLNILRNNIGLNISVTWYGKTYEKAQRENQYYKECIQLIQKFNLSDTWKWGGQVKNIHDVIRSYDFLVHPSKGEGFPNAIVEALSYGLPVVTSNIYDHPLIIKDGYNGFLFDIYDVDTLIDAILKITQLTPHEFLNQSNNAILTANESFSIENLKENYTRLIIKISNI
jgi:glycosyltransferase involved in cell wall biosynthesis